ncbi:MAG: transposase [Betaproteobacteria bacterium]|nr:transposase [Betaproteobacteria bacterium]
MEAVERAPDDPAAQQEEQRSRQCQDIFEQRQAARHSHGKSSETLRISASEPQAMVQRLKRGRGFAASYKPSVLANDDRIIMALALDASSETQMIAPMLDQSARVTGVQAEEVLLAAGCFDDAVIEATLARDVSLLCPEGQWPAKTGEEGLFQKSAFDDDPQTDTDRCPAGQTLTVRTTSQATLRTRAQRVYGTVACGGCPLRAHCTQAAQGRRIKRDPEDAPREALRLVMQHPQAQRIFSQRKAIVEPVFSSLRCQQGLNRLRRRGLQAVKREFALHVLAYNLSRAVALRAALLPFLDASLRRLGQAALACPECVRQPTNFPHSSDPHPTFSHEPGQNSFATASERGGFSEQRLRAMGKRLVTEAAIAAAMERIKRKDHGMTA